MSAEDDESTPLLASSSNPPPPKKSAISRVLSLMTVEPALFLQAVAYGVNENLLINLTVDKLCSVHFEFDAETCLNLDAGNHTIEQDQVQRLATTYNIYIQWMENVPAVFGNILLGYLGDARGRRLPVLLTFTGYMLMALCYLATAYWWWLPVSLLYLSVLPVGLVGGYIGVSNTINAYLSASTGMRSRTTFLSTVEWIKYTAHPLGIYVSSLLYTRGSYVLAYSFYGLLMVVAVLYLLLCVGEPPPAISEAGGSVSSLSSDTNEGMTAHLQRTFAVPMTFRSSGRSGVIVAAYTVVLLLWVFTRGTKDQYLLYERKEFGWKLVQYTYWILCNYIMMAIGLLLVMPACSYYWRVQDAILGLVGGVSMVLFYFVLGAAPQAWLLYVASAVTLCSAIPLVTSRGAISKLVPTTALGATFAFLALVECFVQLVAPPLYTLIYNLTLDTFPGTLYLVMAGAGVIVCCIHVWLLTALR